MSLRTTPPTSPLPNPLLVVAGLFGVTIALWILVPVSVLVAYLCFLVSALIGLSLWQSQQTRSQAQAPKALATLLELASDPEIAAYHWTIADSLRQLLGRGDPIFRKLASSRLEKLADDCESLGNGIVAFTSTESWRVVYEELLRSPGLHLYRSVAYIESAHYWQDGPGKQSTQLNLELHDDRVISIERTAIIADHLWPADSLFPVEPLHSWLDEQHRHGIWLRLVRESELEQDVDLLCDYGVYGSRAVGLQTADPAGRTIRFVLDFNFEKIQQAEAQWSRLAVYAVSYRDLLDQQH